MAEVEGSPKLLAGAASTRTPAQIVAQRAKAAAKYSGNYYLSTYETPIEERRKEIQAGIEMTALVRTCGDTVCAVSFMYPAGIQIWRNRKHVATVATIQELYSYCEKAGW